MNHFETREEAALAAHTVLLCLATSAVAQVKRAPDDQAGYYATVDAYPIHILCSRPGRFLARFSFPSASNTTETLEERGETAREAIDALLTVLKEKCDALHAGIKIFK